MSAENNKRVPVPTKGRTPQELRAMAERLKTSQSRALQLAIHVMSRLTARIEQGATVVVRDRAGKETVMWLPELEAPGASQLNGGASEVEMSSNVRG